MTDARVQAELAETKIELQRLRQSISSGKPTLHKDLSLLTLISKWWGSDSTFTLEEFSSNVEAAAWIGRWQDADKREIALLKLTVSAKLFYLRRSELHEEGAMWQTLKTCSGACVKTFIQTNIISRSYKTGGRQRENPKEFVDRCKALAKKIVYKSDDPLAQRVDREISERILLASFISGLVGTPGRQVLFANPNTLWVKC